MMTLIHQWICNTLIMALTSLLLIGCSGDSQNTESIPSKMVSEKNMDTWLKNHLKDYADSQSLIFRSFLARILQQDDESTNIILYLDSIIEDEEECKKLFIELFQKVKSRSSINDEKMKNILNKIENAFFKQFKLILNENGILRLEKNKEEMLLEFKEMVLEILVESFKKGIHPLEYRK